VHHHHPRNEDEEEDEAEEQQEHEPEDEMDLMDTVRKRKMDKSDEENKTAVRKRNRVDDVLRKEICALSELEKEGQHEKTQSRDWKRTHSLRNFVVQDLRGGRRRSSPLRR